MKDYRRIILQIREHLREKEYIKAYELLEVMFKQHSIDLKNIKLRKFKNKRK